MIGHLYSDPKKHNGQGRGFRQRGHAHSYWPPNPWRGLLLIFAFGCLLYGIQVLFSKDRRITPTIVGPNGKRILHPERKAKRDREIREIYDSEQYVLIATDSKYFPCYSCPDGQTTLFLNEGEVWKYGTTRKKIDGRYPNENFGFTDLAYFIQFKGNYAECLVQEKIKIYDYPLLPEAIVREIELFRPPGNAYDN